MDTTGTEVRRARVGDAAEMARLAGQLGYPMSAAEMGRRLEVLLASERHCLAVAAYAKRLSGWMHVEHRFSLEGGDRAELMGLVVDAAARRRGVGRALVDAAERWALSRELSSLTVRSNAVRLEGASVLRVARLRAQQDAARLHAGGHGEVGGGTTVTTGKARSRSGVSVATLRKLALELPDVVDVTTARRIAFRTNGRMLLCSAIHKSAEPGSIVLRVSAGQRSELMAEYPEALYLPPHYASSSAVVARLSRLDRRSLRAILSAAWAFVTQQAAARKPRRLRARKR